MWYAKFMVGSAEVVVGIDVQSTNEAAEAAVSIAYNATTITREEWRFVGLTREFPEDMVYSKGAIERQRMQAERIRRARAR